jgi:LysR family transcriptional regulator, regulator of abg operon
MQHLHLILALAQDGSLRAAAESLNVTQPALTKSLRQLEDELGAALVLRSPRGVRLTPAGELLAARAARAIRELDRAREEVAWQQHHSAAGVALCVSPSAAVIVLPGALARLRARWPQVQVRVVDAVYPRALAALRAGEVDLAVGPMPAQETAVDLRVQRLFDATQVLIARAGHPLAGATTLAELQHAAWIVTGPAGGPGDPCQLQFEQRGLASPPIRYTCESFSTLLALLPSLDAVAIAPTPFYEQYAAPRGLIQLPMAEALPVAAVHAFWRADAPLTAPAGHLLDALAQEASGVRDGVA